MRYQRHLSLIVSFDHDFFPYELKASSANLMSCSCDVLNLLLGCLLGFGLVQRFAVTSPSNSWVWCRKNSGQVVVPCGCKILLFSLTCSRQSPHYSVLLYSVFFLLCGPAAIGPRFSVSLENYCSQISD